jgi:hypothetical protein
MPQIDSSGGSLKEYEENHGKQVKRFSGSGANRLVLWTNFIVDKGLRNGLALVGELLSILA